MSTEGTPETPLAANGLEQHHSSPKGSWVRIVVYVLLVTAVGLAAWLIYENHQKAAAASASQAAALMNRPVPVQVAAAEQKPMPIFLTALGTVTPYMSVTVKARVSGELEPVRFTEGQQVRQGETIMVIDPRPYQAALDQAKGTLAHDEALLKDAQAQFKRYQALYAAGVVSRETLDADEATQGQYQGAIESDKAAIETAQLQLGWCTIHSPINGRIGLRLVDPGNIITANTTNLVIINQFEPIAVYFTLPENLLPEVLHKLGAERRLPVDAYDRDDVKQLSSGLLLTADNQIDTTTGTDKLKAVFDNKDESLFPNQFVNIHLVLETRPNAIVVPSSAIQSGVQGSYVWVVDTDANEMCIRDSHKSADASTCTTNPADRRPPRPPVNECNGSSPGPAGCTYRWDYPSSTLLTLTPPRFAATAFWRCLVTTIRFRWHALRPSSFLTLCRRLC